MKYVPSLMIIFGFASLLSSHALQADQGSELHAEQCVGCHARMTGGDGTVLYQRDESIINSITELTARVGHCASGANANWNEQQIQYVVEYLNTHFYQF